MYIPFDTNDKNNSLYGYSNNKVEILPLLALIATILFLYDFAGYKRIVYIARFCMGFEKR